MGISVIDLFAGPGGLGEGFASLKDDAGQPVFRIRLSIEKEQSAHKTLELRSFFRKFGDENAPDDYYRYLRGEEITREQLFAKYEQEAKAAKEEAWHFELASDRSYEIDDRIQHALGGDKNWVLIGGPPCQAYSVVGRVRMRGQDPDKYENDPRHYLYREYLRILSTHRPAVFVMENVPGLISSKANGEGTFGRILNDLSLPASKGDGGLYNIYSLKRTSAKIRHSDYVLHAEKYGIPQRRHRLIILGIRNDLSVEPLPMMLHPRTITVLDAIKDLPVVRSGLSKELDSYEEWSQVLKSFAAIMCQSDSVSDDLRREFESIHLDQEPLSLGGRFVWDTSKEQSSIWLQQYAWWFRDERLRGYCNHSGRFHIRQDLCRYLYAICFARAKKTSPCMSDFPEDLRPAHRNIDDAVKGKLFSDRFRVQLGDGPASTVVSHISKDGHYFIHPDPTQCRSMTVREAARIQTFPDNYFFEGTKTSQYAQVGNAVPPLLARQIGQRVAEILFASRYGRGLFSEGCAHITQPKGPPWL